MKKLLLNLSIVICTTITAFAQNVNIPDANFKAYLVGRTDSINTNNDTEISVQEAEAFTGRIDLNYSIISKIIKDLTGLEHFINITYLNIKQQESIKNLNLSQNINLKYLIVGDQRSNRDLSSLDISKNTELLFLNIDSTQINQLDVSNNLKLKKLWIEETPISKIDLTKNILLEELNINPYIRYFNLKFNPLIKFFYAANWNITRLICVPNLNYAKSNFIINNHIKLTENCPIQGNFAENPIDISNVGFSLNLNTLYRGRDLSSKCITKSKDSNTVEMYSTFISKSNEAKIQVELSNPNLETSLELIDTLSLNVIYTGQQCLNYTTVGNARIYTIPNLNIGQKYIFRLEIGGTSQLGYSRTETVANTVNVQLDPTLTSIDSDELLNQNKTLQSIYNLQGIEVDKNYNGLVIYRYTDGTTQKVMQ